MNKKGKAMIGIIGAGLFYGQVIHATEPDTIGNLTETSVKISEIDMDRDFDKAGNILDSFYTGALTKKNSGSSVVYADQNAASKPYASAESICNAKPSKIVIAGKVPPLTSAPAKKGKSKDSLPVGTVALAVGALALGVSIKKKTGPFGGYFDNYAEDAQTVWDYVTGGDSNSGSTGSNSNNTPTTSTHTVVNVDTSSGTVNISTGTDNSCVSSSTDCIGGAWLEDQLEHY